MKKTLYIKFLLAYLLFGILGFLAISTVGSHLIENDLIEETGNSLYQQIHALAEWPAVLHYEDTDMKDSLYETLHSLAALENTTITIIDAKGEIVLDTSQRPDNYTPVRISDFDPIKFGPSYYEIGNFYEIYDTLQLNAIFPITIDMTTKGYLTIHYPMDRLYTQREAVLRDILKLFLILYAFSLIILILFTFSIYLPLLKVIQGAKEYAQGNLNYKIKVKKTDEMGYLASTLNYMGEELQKNHEYQNQFIANVSHDFRSPLTSIKGYAEAMSDGTIPSELYPKYLGIIKSESERLDKLTRSMLVLNSMNKQMILHTTKFDINSVVKNTVAVFEGICRPKKISVNLILEGSELFVSADIDKIQQVLYNLLDNAVKFSYKNTTITIETTDRHGKIYVSVKDMGEGIPKEDQHKIWDRFYKSDASRGKDRKGTGLGLAIVKEIIQAHEQNINVISTEGVGTEFIFTLNPA